MFSILQLGSAGVAALPASADAWRVHIDSMDNLNACVSDAAKGAAWFVLALCLLEAVIFYGLSHTVGKRSRGFYNYAYMIMLIPAIAYASLVNGWGITQFGAPGGDRCFFNSRWLMLVLELPLLVTTAGLLAGVVAFDLANLAICSFLVAMSGLIGGSSEGDNRWIFFAIAILAALPVMRALWNRFYLREGDTTGFDHEYSGAIANRLAFLCTCILVYTVVIVTFWALSQGADVISASTELLILSVCDAVLISSFCISLLSDRETIEKMSEYNARSMGWLRAGVGGSSSEYASIEERTSVGGMGGAQKYGSRA